MTESEQALLASVTQLHYIEVGEKLDEVRGNTLVRNAFANEWPTTPRALRPLTVLVAREADLAPEIARAAEVPVAEVTRRLHEKRGNTLLSNAFPELNAAEGPVEKMAAKIRASVEKLSTSIQDDDSADDDYEDEDEGDEDESQDDRTSNRATGGDRTFDDSDYLDPGLDFSNADLLGKVRAVSVREAPRFVKWLGESLGLSRGTAMKRLNKTRGHSLLSTVFSDKWPERFIPFPGNAIADLPVGVALRYPSLTRLIANLTGKRPQQVSDRLRECDEAELIEGVFPQILDKHQTSPEPSRATAAKSTARESNADSEVPPPSSRKADTVDGRYRLLRRIGTGGFGEVYEAVRLQPPHQTVVIKLELEGKPESLRNEIGIAYELTHQNICAYKDCGMDKARGTYLVLQHGGRSLESIIVEQGQFDAKRAFDVIEQCAAGLDYAHKRGVLHQDVKPANILVDAAGEVRVTDFGIALKGRLVQHTGGKHTVMATHPIGLSDGYAAPEQILGEKARKASDQYALALVFCSMLEGRILDRRYQPRAFSRLTKSQNNALLRALKPDPDERFPTCSEFAQALQRR